jgi:hypothetical protein
MIIVSGNVSANIVVAHVKITLEDKQLKIVI